MNDGHPADGKEKRFSSLLKLFGRGKRDEDVTEEIMDMVNESHEQGVLEENEAEMIGNIFEFGEKQASDVMTHRNNTIITLSPTPIVDIIIMVTGTRDSSRIKVRISANSSRSHKSTTRVPINTYFLTVNKRMTLS